MPQRLFSAKTGYLVSDFGCSCDEELDDGELLSLEPEVAPLPAVPLDEGVALDDDEAPPPDWLFSSELEDDEELGGVEDIEPEAEPELDGEDGVVAPLDEDAPDGELDGLVVEDDEPVADLPPPPLSHAASKLAPNAMETAIARVDNLMGPPWLGYCGVEQGLGRVARHLSIPLLRIKGATGALTGLLASKAAVFGRGVGAGRLRSHAVLAAASETAVTSLQTFMRLSAANAMPAVPSRP